MLRRRMILLAAAGVALLGASAFALACGDDDEEEGDGAAATKVDVELNEWKVIPSQASVSAGEIEFVAKNTGKAKHELMVIKTDTDPARLPVSGGRVDESKAGKEIGEIEEFDPGKTESGKFKLSSGKYALICNIAGHYEQGMYVGFEVR